jgi:branched-chain amino acid transport system ATP-binding protein
MPALLEASNLEAYYGWSKVLHGLDFTVEQDKVTVVLGANGAGKTTLLRAISGMIRTAGEICFAAERIDGQAPEDIVRRGIAHVPEGRGTFVNLTVEENLRLGAYVRRDKAGIRQDLDRVFHFFPVLKEKSRNPAGVLSGGEQQMLAVARGLMLRPRLLLLDEPSLGLSPVLVTELFRIVREINESERVTVLLVEQDAVAALELAHQAYLLETGSIVTSGSAAELRENDSIRRSYLGY